MNKYLVIIICILSGQLLSSCTLSHGLENHPPVDVPHAQITLSTRYERYIDWPKLAELLDTLAELGCGDVEINGFYWNSYPCFSFSTLPQFEDVDEITLQYRHENSDQNADPSPQEQYDLDCVHQWCGRNQTLHASVFFGSDVRFDAIREITNILQTNNIVVHLMKPIEESDPKNIRIRLSQPPEKNAKKPESPLKWAEQYFENN